MTSPASYRLPGRRGWWRDLFTIIGIAAMCEIIGDLFGIEGWSTLGVFTFVGVPLAATLGLLTEPPKEPADEW